MPYEDLRAFLTKLDQEGQLARVRREVDPRFELAEVCRKIGLKGGPAVLFERVKGHSMPVVAQVVGTLQRAAWALDSTVEGMVAKVQDAMDPAKHIRPTIVSTGPCQDVVLTGDQVDLTSLPVPTWNEKDGGPYFTAGYQIAKDPETGMRNFSLHRMQLMGPRKTGILAHPPVHLGIYRHKAEEKGEPLEIAVAIGVDPLLEFVAECPIPIGQDEFAFAGALKGKPIEMVRCRTVDLEVPATAEIVLEGRIPPNVLEWEGPFGEHTGYYGDAGHRHVIEYTAITHRKDAYFRGLYLGKPPSGEGHILTEVGRSAVLLSEMKNIVPTVKAARVTAGGCAWLNAIISIHKPRVPDYPYATEGWGKQAILTAFASHLRIKNVIVVDDDIDIFNMDEVEWALATRFQPNRGLVTVPETTGFVLDPSQLETRGLTSKMGIDATLPLHVKYPEVPYPPKEIVEKVDKEWEEYFR